MPSLGCWLVDYGLDCVENKLLVDYLGLIIFRSSLQYKFVNRSLAIWSSSL